MVREIYYSESDYQSLFVETVNILQHEVEEFINGYVRESFMALLTVFLKLKQLMKSITGILNHN